MAPCSSLDLAMAVMAPGVLFHRRALAHASFIRGGRERSASGRRSRNLAVSASSNGQPKNLVPLELKNSCGELSLGQTLYLRVGVDPSVTEFAVASGCAGVPISPCAAVPSLTSDSDKKGPVIMEIPLDKIRRPLMRTRANDPVKVQELMDSIRVIGLQVPIDVLEVDGVYYGFSGCHRYEAHQRLGLPTIRCKVRRGTKETLRHHMR